MPTLPHPDLKQYWFHRRTMAYLALLALLFFAGTAVAGYVQPRMFPVIETLCWAFLAVIAMYYGGTALEHVTNAWHMNKVVKASAELEEPEEPYEQAQENRASPQTWKSKFAANMATNVKKE